MGSHIQRAKNPGSYVHVKESGAHRFTVPKRSSRLPKSGVSASQGNAGPSLTSARICRIGVVVTPQQSC